MLNSVVVPEVGNYIKINEDICSDIDVLDWLGEQPENRFKVQSVEKETNGVWVEGCDYRIDLDECVVL